MTPARRLLSRFSCSRFFLNLFILVMACINVSVVNVNDNFTLASKDLEESSSFTTRPSRQKYV